MWSYKNRFWIRQSSDRLAAFLWRLIRGMCLVAPLFGCQRAWRSPPHLSASILCSRYLHWQCCLFGFLEIGCAMLRSIKKESIVPYRTSPQKFFLDSWSIVGYNTLQGINLSFWSASSEWYAADTLLAVAYRLRYFLEILYYDYWNLSRPRHILLPSI